MAKQTIDVQLTWEDVSTGSAEETGQDTCRLAIAERFGALGPNNRNQLLRGRYYG